MFDSKDMENWYRGSLDIYKDYQNFFIEGFYNFREMFSPYWKNLEKAHKFFDVLNEIEEAAPSWATENEVVYENQTLKLRFFPSPRRDPRKRPILVLPPQAGHHSNLADYSAAQSLMRVFQRYGYDAYTCHWLSASPEYKELSVADYIRLTNEAVDAIRERSGFYKIHIMGQCQGGWQAAIYTSFYQEKIASLVTAAAPIDVNAAPSEIVRMAQESPVELYEMMVALGNGRMNGLFILLGFKSMQAEEHYVHKYFKLWNLIKNNDQDGLRRFIFFEGWYDYTQFLPGKFYLEVIKNIFIDNKLTQPGAWVIDGRPVDLKNINCPVIILAGTKDHITPPGQAFALKNFISTPEEDIVEILTNGGHIGTLMGTEALREDWTAVAEVLELSI